MHDYATHVYGMHAGLPQTSPDYPAASHHPVPALRPPPPFYFVILVDPVSLQLSALINFSMFLNIRDGWL